MLPTHDKLQPERKQHQNGEQHPQGVADRSSPPTSLRPAPLVRHVARPSSLRRVVLAGLQRRRGSLLLVTVRPFDQLTHLVFADRLAVCDLEHHVQQDGPQRQQFRQQHPFIWLTASRSADTQDDPSTPLAEADACPQRRGLDARELNFRQLGPERPVSKRSLHSSFSSIRPVPPEEPGARNVRRDKRFASANRVRQQHPHRGDVSENQPVRSTGHHGRPSASRVRELEQFGGGELRQPQLGGNTLEARGIDNPSSIPLNGEADNFELQVHRLTI